MTFRLDTYPEAQIATLMNPQHASSTEPALCCLLHTGPLPTSHQVQVWVGGTQQIAEQEGPQEVFSWQCAQGVEMSIHLMHHDRLTKAWRGWWQGETTIAHMGTLAVQVYCAGVLQPAGLSPSSAPVPSSITSGASDQQNGTHPQAVSAALSWPTLLDTPARPLPATDAEPEDDLWSNPPSEASVRAAETSEQKMTEDETDQDLLEEEDDWKNSELEEEEDRENPEPARMQDGQAGADAPSGQRDDHAALPHPTAPAGTTIAALPANTAWSQAAHQEAQERLAALLSTMPPNTILVDLRQHSPTPRARRAAAKSGPQKLGLSKELLRTLYGGRYWDRGSAIQTSRRLVSTHPARWCHVVINPDDREGLGELVTALTQGFSLVVLDGETSYAESARAAVISALRQRVMNLHEGPCS
ncbi:MAG TPA: hypothetical protein VFV38_22170 [Ktedonobacteraceae bacterium]|nr:hypothetical protein [Ktedonobacteraceae bacterium]